MATKLTGYSEHSQSGSDAIKTFTTSIEKPTKEHPTVTTGVVEGVTFESTVAAGTARPSNMKRKRPSYTQHFPEMDEFDRKTISSDSDTEVESVKPPLQQSRLTSTSTGPQPLLHLQKSLRRQPEHQQGHIEQSSDSDWPNRNKPDRCIRCIVQRRKCDGKKPMCSLCKKVVRECEYPAGRPSRTELERAGVTRHSRGSGNWRKRDHLPIASADSTRSAVETIHEAMIPGPGSAIVPCKENHTQQESFGGVQKALADDGIGWTNDDHFAFLERLEDGKLDHLDEQLFDDTTALFEDFKLFDGAITDAWTREQNAKLELNWDKPSLRNGYGRLTGNLMHSAGSDAGSLSALRTRCGVDNPRTGVHSSVCANLDRGQLSQTRGKGLLGL